MSTISMEYPRWLEHHKYKIASSKRKLLCALAMFLSYRIASLNNGDFVVEGEQVTEEANVRMSKLWLNGKAS